MWTILPGFAYAQVIKLQRRFLLIKVEHRYISGLAADYITPLKTAGLSYNINTSFVERVNRIIRQSVSKLTRRTWGPAQFSLELYEHLYWWLAYYHFVRQHESLRVKMEKPIERKGRLTPALVSAATDQLSNPLREPNSTRKGEMSGMFCPDSTCIFVGVAILTQKPRQVGAVSLSARDWA